MKTFYSAQDIETLARQGVRELLIDENTVLTDLARAAASRLGLRLLTSDRVASPAVRGAEVLRPAGRVAAMAASAGIPAKPRGCQHGLLGTAQAGKAEAVATTGKVVDELVDLVKQLNKGS